MFIDHSFFLITQILYSSCTLYVKNTIDHVQNHSSSTKTTWFIDHKKKSSPGQRARDLTLGGLGMMAVILSPLVDFIGDS